MQRFPTFDSSSCGESGVDKLLSDSCKASPMVKHREGEISEGLISELYPSRILKQWENSLQYPNFRHASRSRLELGKCLYAGCLQGGEEEFKYGRESYSLNNLLREAENGLADAVNAFTELKSLLN